MKKRITQSERISGRFGSALALVAVLFAVFGGMAQEVYHPITEGCIWSVSNEKYMTAGDTVLDGKTYLKIYRQVGDQPFEFSLESAEYFAAIRNDVAEKKVYAYLPAGTLIRDFLTFSSVQTDTAMEVLIYDFSLKLGDTLIYYVLGDYVVKSIAVRAETANISVGWSGYSSVSYHYNETDTFVVLTDNTFRSQLFLHGLTYNAKDYIWIESIGSMCGFNEGTQISLSDYGYQILLCFADSSGTLFQSGFDFDDDSDDCFTNGFGGDVTEREMLDIRIHPNPVTDMLNISTSKPCDELFSVQILDTKGSCVYQGLFSDTDIKTSIDMKQIPKGLYMLQIQQANKKSCYKIIKL